MMYFFVEGKKAILTNGFIKRKHRKHQKGKLNVQRYIGLTIFSEEED